MSTNATVGIDLGTTFSCVGAYRNKSIDIFANDLGNKITPSVVSFHQGRRFIGKAAQQRSSANASNTIYDSKRMLGRKFNDEVLKNDIKNWQFELNNDDGRPQIHVDMQGCTRNYKPEEISAMILVEMKEIAKCRLRKEIKQAVITVPAYFNDAQRQATKDAASIAKLNVLKLLNEPVAAAIAYGLDKKRDSERKVLVYDLGGGTFDVSLLTVKNHEFTVKTYAGNSHLGGQDFNNRMTDYLIQEFKRKFNEDISLDKKAIAKLRDACEKAKCELTACMKTTIYIENLTSNNDFEMELFRSTFENLNDDLFQSTIGEVEKAMKTIEWTKSDIDDIVLIGGSTRIPKIQEMLRNYFGGKELYTSISPDEAVAYGAAVYAAILDGINPELRSFKFTDVTAMALGTDLEDGLYSIIIPRNTEIPAEKTETYNTAKDYQTSMSVQVLEGESIMCNDNFMLGKFTLDNLPSHPKGEVKADVTFKVDENGILHAKAQDKSNSNNVESIDIVYKQYGLSQKEIDEMAEHAEKMRLLDEKQKETAIRENQPSKLPQDASQQPVPSKAADNGSVKNTQTAESSTENQLNNNKTEIKFKGGASVAVPGFKADGKLDFEYKKNKT